jgi:hypothetical protein
LHTQYGLSHNQQFNPIDAILFQDLKDQYNGSWALVIADRGVGAIKWDGSEYKVVANNGQSGIQTFSSGRGGAIKDWMKTHVGSLRKFFVAADNQYAKNTKRKRSAANAVAPTQDVSVDSLMKRLQPLWVKYVKSAEADIRGMVKTMIDSGSYERATNKINRLKSLYQRLIAIESGESYDRYSRDPVKDALIGALGMAAHQFYPDETGEVNRRHNGEFVVQYATGIKHLLQDITAGDVNKIGVVLRYFKRTVL